MTRKLLIARLHLLEDDLLAHDLATEANRETLKEARATIRNDKQTDRAEIAERCFGFSLVLLIIAGFGLPMGIVSALFGWAGAALIGALTALALLAAAGLLALTIKLTD